MRSVAFVVLLVLLAGCASSDVRDAPSTTTATPATSTPAEAAPTPTTSGNATNASANETPVTPTPVTAPTPATNATNDTPAAPVAFWLNLTHDYAAADANVSFEVPANASASNLSLDFRVSSTLTGYACAGTLRIQVYAPNGTLVADARAAPTVAQSAAYHCGVLYADATQGVHEGPVVPGTWHAVFTGPGTGVGQVAVKPANG